ncbi:Serine/threonine protein kinase related protein [Minicystis rosea]|nr:Serine/threonine protein kinase related protein [Minicystis rosea]
MKRPRVPPILVALLAASATAGAGTWKRWRHHAVMPVASAVGVPAPSTLPAGSAVASAAAFAPQVPAPAGPARSFRGDRARRHRSAFVGPREAPRVQFSWDAGAPIEAMPAITPEGDVVVASLSGKVTRLTPAGTVVWSADLGERIYASPLLLNDAIVIGSDAKRFVSLSLATGKTRWQLDADAEADTAPAEAPGGLVIAAAGRVLFGLRADGGVRFRLKLPRKIYASPAVADDGTIYVGAQDRRLHAITPDGKARWSRDLGGDVDCAPAIGDDGTIFAASDAGQVLAFDAQGNERWRAAVGGFVRGGLTVGRAGAVIAGTYGPGPRVVALDAVTGAERWSFRVQGTGAPEFGIHGSPLEDAEGKLYFGAQDDQVYALDPNGKLLWTHPTRGDVDAPLVIGPGGVLYVGSDDGRLYALH